VRVLIDILTPKQVRLFQKLREELFRRNHKVRLLSRKYREVNQLLLRKKIDTVVVGRHGGQILSEKLHASTERTHDLIPVVKEFGPDICVSFSSPELSRVSFGLGIPHICISDSPHATAVSKLCIPLSEKLMSPKMIPKERWMGYGITEERIIQYNALDPWAWLKDFKPDYAVLEKIGLNKETPIVTIRSAETFASYLQGDIPKVQSIINFARILNDVNDKVQVVIIPRYVEQIKEFQESLKDNIIIMDTLVDGPSLLSFSDVFVGAGGTMSAEAALLGTPTISCFPGESYIIEQYLIEEGLIEREINFQILLKKVQETLEKSDVIKRENEIKVKKIVSAYDDPIEIISDEIEKQGNT
jgi:predicted glycosyltransferase